MVRTGAHEVKEELRKDKWCKAIVFYLDNVICLDLSTLPSFKLLQNACNQAFQAVATNIIELYICHRICHEQNCAQDMAWDKKDIHVLIRL